MKQILKKMNYLATMGTYAFMSHPVMARDLESVASNLTNRTFKLALLVVPIGFAISSIFMAVGNPRGGQLMGMTLMAGVAAIGGTSVFNWLKNIVG